ncbi:MAG: phosphoadenylyl-sulfate reductase [Pseudomonadales bacterium]|jgi:phosphoadenosine phosphosulfate reductase
MRLEDQVTRVASLNAEFSDQSTLAMIEALVCDQILGPMAVVTSFGAESAVLLHLIARANLAAPVIFIDTGFHFAETIAYRDELTDRLGLTCLETVQVDPITRKRHDPRQRLHLTDPDACCALRKVEVLDRALKPFTAWCTGQKRYQSQTRQRIDPFEVDLVRRKFKVNPLADWSSQAIRDYAAQHDLPSHPLVDRGFSSIGCSPCTDPIQQGEAPRAGRWRGQEKTECGLHAASSVFFREGKVA